MNCFQVSAESSIHLLRLVRHFRQARQAGRRSFLLTSQWPDEGKTSLVVELAQTMASPESRLLLVDGDRRRPTLSRHFQCSGAGLAEALQSHQAPRPEERAPGLDVLGAGLNPGLAVTVPPASVEPFRAWTQSYDLTLVDSPPLAVCSDALDLARLCDAVILIVSSRAYRGPEEHRTVTELKRQGCTLEGIIYTRHDEPETPGSLPPTLWGRLLVWSGLKP